MLTPDYLFNVSDRIVDLYEELNTFAIKDICRRLTNTDFEITGSAEWQYRMLQEAGMSREEINKKIASITHKSQNEIRKVFEESSYKSYNADMSVYKAFGLTPLPFAQSPYMLQLLQAAYEQTNGTLHNLTQTTADASQRLLINTLSAMQMRVSSGQQSYNQAIRQAVNTIAAEGVKVQYKGKERNLESVVRMAVVTGVNQASIRVQLQAAEKMGCDTILTTAHLGARIGDGYKGHVNWQGGVYSVSGQKYPEEEKRIGQKIGDFYGDTGFGKVDGLGGANCRHNVRPWIVGHSSNPYVDKDGNPKIDAEENKKRYEAQQGQRRRESNIRNTKRKLQALRTSIDSSAETDVKEALQQDYDRQALQLKRQQNEYEQYCAQNELRTKNERLQIAGYSHKEAKRAYHASKRAEDTFGGSGGMELNKKVYFDPKNDYTIELEGYEKRVNEGLSLAAGKVAQQGAETGYEHMYLVDLENGELDYYETNNLQDSVGYEFWNHLNKNKMKSYAFVHNHNTAGSFSETDMQTLLTEEQISVMIAVRNDAVKYIAERSETLLKNVLLDDLYKSEIQELNELLKDGMISVGERTIRREELIVKNALRDYTKGGKLVEIDGRHK